MTHTGEIKSDPPQLAVNPGNPEALKYGRLWDIEAYREIAPGEYAAPLFLQQARPRAGASVIDFGCGTGRGSLLLVILGQLNVTMVDFVNNCLDPDIRDACRSQAHTLRFLKADLEKPLPVAAEYGFCTDVMEHIPPDKVNVVLDNILRAAQHVFFQISTEEDRCGALIGEPLHLSVHPYGWWLDQFTKRDCIVHWSTEIEGYCFFYVTGWVNAQAIVDVGVLNIGEEQIKANVRHNCAQGWQQVQPHETNNLEVMILGGGPSIIGLEADIKQKRADGVKLVTLNGAYNWALENGLVPSAQIIVDARPFNARFTKPVVDGCKYLIASQCDPAVFDGLPKDRTYIWHTTAELIGKILSEHYELWWGVPGGSTVLLRAIPLMRMLGYRKFHLYGCDSCLSEGRYRILQPDGRWISGISTPEVKYGGGSGPLEFSDISEAMEASGHAAPGSEPVHYQHHHAYDQEENESDVVVAVTVQPHGRVFWCHPWMIAQAQEMMSMIRFLGNEIELEIHGEGLLTHILELGATLAIAEEGKEEIKRERYRG